MRFRPFVVIALMFVLAACQQTATQPGPDPDPDPTPPVLADLLEIAPATAQGGDTVTVSYRGVSGAVSVSIDGIEAQQVGEPVEGDDDILDVDVVVPVGAVGWSSVEVASSDASLALGANDREFFVGTVLSSLGSDLQAVQDALDAIEVGGALLIPAGTYSGNEPLGGLVIDNRLLVGSGAGDTVVEGVTQLTVYARTTNTAGIADLTLAADATTVFGGTDVSSLAWPIDRVPVTTSLGRFLVWNATWTGNGTITPPTIDPDTLEVTSYGVADGSLDRDSSAVNMAFEFDGATVVLNDMYMFDTSAIGPWTIVDSDIWVQDRFQVYQESGNVLVRDSRLSTVGDPLTALTGPLLEFEIDAFDGAIVDSELTSTGVLRFEADDGGNREIIRSRLRSEDTMDLEGDYLGSFLIEDSWLYANGTIDLDNVAEAGWLRIVRSTLEAEGSVRISIYYSGFIEIEASTLRSRTGRVAVDVDEGGSIAIRESTLQSLLDQVRVEVYMGSIDIVDSTIEAATRVDIDTDAAGNINVIGSTITAGTYIDFYMDYFGTLTIADSTLFAGTYLEIDPWSGGSSQIDIRDSLLEAIEYVEISDTDGGDVTIEGSTLRAYCEYVDIARDPGSIYITDSTLETVGTMPDGAACAFLGGQNVTVFTESGMVVLSNVTIDARGDVLVEDYSGGSDAPPALITQVGSADMRVDAGSAISAVGDIRFGTAGALEVLGSDFTAGGAVVLASPLLGDITTTLSTFTPAPTLVTAFP